MTKSADFGPNTHVPISLSPVVPGLDKVDKERVLFFISLKGCKATLDCCCLS